jgi:hypothetical protein
MYQFNSLPAAGKETAETEAPKVKAWVSYN